MATLRYPREVPPGGFWYLQKETRLRVEGESMRDLTQRVIEHRKYKNLLPVDWMTVASEVERQICSRLGTFHCKPEGPDDVWVPVQIDNTVLSTRNIASASKAALEYLKNGGELVSRELATSRAEKCAKCPINWPITGCKCGWLYKAIEKLVPKERRFENLGVCAICQCSLPAKVWLPRPVIDASTVGRNLQFPQDGSCWQADPEG